MATKASRSDDAAPATTAGRRARSARTPEAEEPSGERVSAAVYNAFIAGVDLDSIRLAAADIRAHAAPARKKLLPAVRESSRYENREDHVIMIHELTFLGTYKDEAEPAVSIRAEFEVRYATAERMTDDIFTEFRRRNLPLNSWPYFREFVHAALARTGWPVFVLPVYKAMGAPLAPSTSR